MDLIQINTYFFVPSSYKRTPVEKSNEKFTLDDTYKSQYFGEHYEFSIEIEGLSPAMHDNLLSLKNLNRPYDGTSKESLTLTDKNGISYTVDIKANGYDFEEEQGSGETWRWELELVEKGG